MKHTKEEIDALSSIQGMTQEEVKEIMKYTDQVTELAQKSITDLNKFIKSCKKKDLIISLFISYFLGQMNFLKPDAKDLVIKAINNIDKIDAHCQEREKMFQKAKSL